MRKSDRLIWSLSRMKSKTEKITEIKPSVTDVGVYRWPAAFVPVWLHPRGTNPFVCTGAVKQAHILLVYPPAVPAWIERCHCLRGRRVALCVYEPDRGKNSWEQRPRKSQSCSEAAVLIRAWNTPGCSPPGPGEWGRFFGLSPVYFSGGWKDLDLHQLWLHQV